MADISILATPGPYHIIAYGTLLGSSVFQSFIGGPVAYKTLPRPQFSSLQQAIFPIYFTLQSALPVVLALTYPSTATTNSSSLSSSPFGASSSSARNGLGGFLAKENRFRVLVPIATVFAISLSNLLIFGPATTRIMKERKHQETRDGKKSYDSPPHSKEMIRLNKAFGKMHSVSALLNLAGLLVLMWYGVELAARI